MSNKIKGFHPSYQHRAMSYDCDKELSGLIEQHQAAIYQICRVYFPYDHYQRTSLYNEIVYRIWRGMQSFRGESTSRTWVYRIAINTAINFYHADACKRKFIPLNERLAETLPNEEENQMLHDLYALIERLNALEKAVIYMYLDRAPQAEIAETLDLTVTNVSTIIGRIKVKLKKLKDEESRKQRP